MAHVRKTIRDAAKAALTGLTTTGARVFASRVYDLQESDLPGLRVYTNGESAAPSSAGVGHSVERVLELVIEACSKKASGLDDELDAMLEEVEVALGAGLAPAKSVELRRVEIEMQGEADKPIGVARMTFEVSYFTALGAPGAAL
jgi:hypothetical protein